MKLQKVIIVLDVTVGPYLSPERCYSGPSGTAVGYPHINFKGGDKYGKHLFAGSHLFAGKHLVADREVGLIRVSLPGMRP